MSLTGESLGSEQFRRALLDLALNVASVLVIALALFLLDRRRNNPPCPPGRGGSRRQ